MASESKYHFSMTLLFYNEEENVIPVVTSLRDALRGAGVDFQLILVNNGSSDRTPVFIRELAAADPRLKEVTVSRNLGYGWGAISGLNAAQGEWVGFMAGDGQIDPRDVIRLFREAESGGDLIKVRRAYRQDGFIRGAISDLYVMLICLLFDMPFYDVNATPRIFQKRWLEKFCLVSRDWFLDAEILIKSRFLGLSVKEIPIVFRRRTGGRSNVKLMTIFEFLKNIAAYRLGRGLRQWKRKIGLKS